MPSIRILGIDPGLTRAGWGVIERNGSHLKFIACGTISSPKAAPLAERLVFLHKGVQSIIEQYQPHQAAIEETFVSVNGASTLKLGQARGVLLMSLALADLPVSEYAARLIKKTVVGNGAADKNQMAMMVTALLSGAREQLETAKHDAVDALAIAVCHSNHS